MDDNTPETTAQTPPPGQRGGKKVTGRIAVITIAVLLVLAGAALFIMGANRSDFEMGGSASPTPGIERPLDNETPTPTPSPTSEPVDRSEVTIEVLNGTGVAGEASYLQEQLEDLGYEDIEVGNAESQNNTTTTVTYSSSLPEENREEITELLESIYTDVETEIGSGATTEVVIVTGTRTGSSPRATSTASPTATARPTSTP